MENTSRNCSHRKNVDYKFPILVLDAAVILINTSSEDFLNRIPEDLLEKMFPLLKELFQKMQGSISPTNCCWDQRCVRSKKYDIASFIFKVSMNRALSLNWAPVDVRSSIFSTESEFFNFLINYWEESPLLIRKTFKDLENKATIFNSLIHSFDSSTTGTILFSVLQHMVSCPPITSDELDIFSFLDEVKGVLGSPIVYGQDIRVLKTPKPASGIGQANLKKEMHFFDDNMVSKITDASDVQKYQEAFQDGYTVALRGMEFRSDKIAAFVDSLAILFGQPSVGVNIYLTPPGSQGLAQHYDDHCVFVWQLFGQKKWRISSSSATALPRLYEPIVPMSGLKDDECGCIQYLLNQGDILYIPRGFVHEARTVIDEKESQDEVSIDFSLHLTLGIEVETPFEWEGFAHIALHCWTEKQKQASSTITDSKQRVMFVMLLHMAIRLIANENSTFRKACMVAAFPLSSDTLLWNHKAIFYYVIEKIDASTSFVEVFKWIEKVVQERNDDSLQWMRWLRHLSQDGEGKDKVNFNNLLEIFEDLVLLYTGRIAEAMEEKFYHFKSMFCRDAVFEDACRCFKTLLEKYRKIRRQYMKGMLSLHST